MRRREYAAFVLPSVIVMFGLLIIPLYRTIEWSFKDVTYGSSGKFAGLSNYGEALTDPRFGQAVIFTVGLTIASTALLLVGGYVLATAVNTLRRTRPWALGLLLVSYVLPQVVGATMFSWLFDKSFGGVAEYLLHMVTGQQVHWFTSAWPNRIMLLLNIVWFMLPFAMLMIMAGLQGVSTDITEAAEIDGANSWQRHWHVIIPSIRGILGFVTLICIMDILRVFDQLIPLSPQAIQLNNESVMLYIYNIAFQNGGQHLGLGSAVNVLLIMIILAMLSPFIVGLLKEARKS